MQTYTETILVGGREGTLFSDVHFLDSDGLVPSEGEVINPDHPIQEIRVSADWVVDGIAVDYVTKTQTVITRNHGSEFNDARLHKITLGVNEKIVNVFGLAGYLSFYKRSLVNSIGFMILDTKTANTRVAGPFGNTHMFTEASVYSAADVVALGGFAQDISNMGLSGLFFTRL